MRAVVLDDGDGKQVTSRAQIAKTGRFMDPRYGRFSITREEFAKWMTNFTALSVGEGRLGLAVDIDHGPEKRGDTRAAGWVTSLDTRGPDGKSDTPDELWATVEWNSLGQQLVGDRIYAYLSPSYKADAKDETGKSLGTALAGIGLTNRPFLTMATVTLDELHDFEKVPDVEPVDSPPAMTDFLKRAREALQLGEDASEDKVLESIAAAVKPADPPPTTKTLAEQAKESGQILLDAEQYATLTTNANAGAAAAKELSETKRDGAFDAALDSGRVTPAQKDDMFALHELNSELYFKTLDGLQPVVSTVEKGGTGARTITGANTTAAAEARDAGVELDEDSAAIDAKIHTLMAAEPTLTYSVALDRVLAEQGV